MTDTEKTLSIQVNMDYVPTGLYCQGDYVADAYCEGINRHLDIVGLPMETRGYIDSHSNLPLEVELDYRKKIQVGLQTVSLIDRVSPLSIEVRSYIETSNPMAIQARSLIDTVDQLPIHAHFTVESEANIPLESRMVVERTDTLSMGVEGLIDTVDPLPIHVHFTVDSDSGLSIEATSGVDTVSVTPIESRLIVSNESNLPIEVTMNHVPTGSYCLGDYCMDFYCTDINAFLGTNPLAIESIVHIDTQKDLPIQSRVQITNESNLPIEVRSYIDTSNPLAIESIVHIDTQEDLPIQSRVYITAEENLPIGIRTYIDAQAGLPLEAVQVKSEGLPIQCRAFLYNTSQFRYMGDYPSRGNSNTGNWTATSTSAGDFHTDNLNTDIVEQVWRSAGDVVVTLTCDTEVEQGVEMDTLAILNHNLSGGATLTIIGSTTSDFTDIRYQKIIDQVPPNKVIVIEDPRPSQPCRYWRFDIVDIGNRDGFIQIGSIVFGSSEVFDMRENFNGRVSFEKRVHTDKVVTEGYTNVENVRNRSNVLTLDFRDLRSDGVNYLKLQRMFERFQTTHKVLVVPYPKQPLRFSVFSKLEQLPIEEHTQEGDAIVDMALTFDESL